MTQGNDDQHDRAAILARRRRFVALALTGLASTGCTPAAQPTACLSVAPPEDQTQPLDESEPSPGADGPFVEDPGQPVQSTDPEGAGDSGTEEPTIEDPRPEVCLRMVQPKPNPKPCLKRATPRPCLDMVAPPINTTTNPSKTKPSKKSPPPQPCLLMIDVN